VTPGESFMVFAIPFSGTAAFFNHTPQGSAGTMPRGLVSGVLSIAVSMSDRDSDAIEAAYRVTVEQVNEILRVAAVEFAPFKEGLPGRLMTRLTARWMRVERERAIAEELSRRFRPAEDAGRGSDGGAAP
jgi:hypothetical protein